MVKATGHFVGFNLNCHNDLCGTVGLILQRMRFHDMHDTTPPPFSDVLNPLLCVRSWRLTFLSIEFLSVEQKLMLH
jgi:hypothetical protein